MSHKKIKGFATVAILALLVIMAVMGVALVYVSTNSSQNAVRALVGNEAYQAAAAGKELAAYQSLRGSGCSSFNVHFPAWPDIAVQGACVLGSATENGVAVAIHSWTIIACNAGSCPSSPSESYVERQLTMTIAR